MKFIEETLNEFDKVLEFNPNLPEVINCRGRAYKHLKRFDLPLKDHSRAIELDQTYAKAYRNRAKALRAMGKNDLAKVDEKKANRLTSLQNKFNLEWKKITWPSLGEDGLKFLVQSA